jgi:hypothetical protein
VNSEDVFGFLPQRGEMAARVRAHDWAGFDVGSGPVWCMSSLSDARKSPFKKLTACGWITSFLRSTRDHTVTQNDSINDKRSLRVAHGWNIRQYAAF